MSDNARGRRNTTRHLSPERVPEVAPRGTGPLDYLIPWVIELRIGETAEVLQVEVAEKIVLGRSDKEKQTVPDVDLEPLNAYHYGVSRQHAVISARNSRITVRDMDSANGTFLNGGRLEPGKEYRLRHGDELSLAKFAMQVFFVVMPSSYEKNATPYDNVSIPKIGSGQHVLVLDEDDAVAHNISGVLSQAGFRVRTCRSVNEAFTAVETQMPAAVVMELVLADANGLDLVHYLRGQEGGGEIPIMVITGATGGYQMGQAIDAGVDIFLTKPVGVDELIRGFGKIVPQMG